MRPFVAFLPEVEFPMKRVGFNDKMMHTVWALIMYLVCCQIPLYGIIKQDNSDPLYWLRGILASNKGTIMELGLGPIITSGLIMQLLVGSRFIDVNMQSKDDRELFQAS